MYHRASLLPLLLLCISWIKADMRNMLTQLDYDLDHITIDMPIRVGVLDYNRDMIQEYIRRLWVSSQDKLHSMPGDSKRAVFEADKTITYGSMGFGTPIALKRIIQKLIVIALSKDIPLVMCSCHPTVERIILIMQIILDIRKARPDLMRPLVYTSLASGDLLQDYLMVVALIESGYRFLTVNIIDPTYPDFTKLPSTGGKRDRELKALQDQYAATSHVELQKSLEEKINILGKAELIEYFTTHLEADLIDRFQPTASGQVSLSVRSFDNPEIYQARAKRNAEEKSDIFVMVDPETGEFKVEHAYITQANVLKFPDLVIFLPIHRPLQIYILKTMYKKSGSLRCVVDRLKKQPTKSRSRLLEFFEGCEIESGFAWYNNSFLTFQDMLYDVVHSDAVVYQMYKSFQYSTYGKIQSSKIDIEEHKKGNVIEMTQGESFPPDKYEKFVIS